MIREIKGWHVLAATLVFFAVTIAVNGLFIGLAVGTFSGEEAPKSYRQGLAYNDVLDRRARQVALGWSAALAAERGEVVVTVTDAAGAPVTGLALDGAARHPSDAALDRRLDFAEAGRGRYVAPLTPRLDEGAWTVRAADESAPFEVERRIWIR